MIELTLGHIAAIVDGQLFGDVSAVVDRVESDSRTVGPRTLFAAFVGDRVDGHDYIGTAIEAGAVAALVSKQVDAPNVIVVDDVISALSTLARYQVDQQRAKVLALTGSHGKTSVKDLLAHILSGHADVVAAKGSLNNELGVPLTVLRATSETDYVVVEMGARGAGHIAWLCSIAPPDVAAMLNVGSAHVGEFGSTEAIAEAKSEILQGLTDSATAVLNADDPMVMAAAHVTTAPILTFGACGDLAVSDVELNDVGEPRFRLTFKGETRSAQVPQTGRHVAYNAAAAVAMAVSAGMPFDQAVARLSSAKPASPMRMQRLERGDGVLVINDAYNANPESMTAALNAVADLTANRRIAVLGPMLELGDASEQAQRAIGSLASDVGFDRLIAVGPQAAAIAEGAGQIGEVVPDVDAAVDRLSVWLVSGDVVLVKASRGCRLERVADRLAAEAMEGPLDR